jgi:hypothetical protein
MTLWKRKLFRGRCNLEEKEAGMSFSPRKRCVRPSPGLMDIHRKMVSITLQSTDVYLFSLLVYFCHQETKIFKFDILAKNLLSGAQKS